MAIFSLASTTVLAGAGHGSGNAQTDAQQPIDRTISFEAGDMWFTPGELDIEPGQTVKFEITNTGNLEHEFVIGNAAAQEEHRKMMREMASGGGHDMSGGHHGDGDGMPSVAVAPGESATLVWTAPQDSSKIEFACNIPGHYESGMSGNINLQG
ncbi:cupredoxin domain-containing protein [Halomonas salina]|uniref:cupredoxin domain-containing protein n=1 Tax=Halomonas salina TaxID=42565 RepID=UPI001F2C9A19|nr:plastocyanin/azurin family copper-binding protein [Halomonas salina]